MDKELIAYLNTRFDEVNKRIDSRFRETRVQVESLRGQIQQVAEGVAAGNENLEAFRTDVARQFDEVRHLFNISHSNLHHRVGSLEEWREKIDPRPPATRKRRA